MSLHRWLHNQFPPFFSVVHCPLGHGKLQAAHFLILSSHLFFCLPCLLPPFTLLCKMVLTRPDAQETSPDTTSVFISFMTVRRSSCGLIACQGQKIPHSADGIQICDLQSLSTIATVAYRSFKQCMIIICLEPYLFHFWWPWPDFTVMDVMQR